MAVNRAESGSGPRALFPQGPSLEEKDFSTKEFIVRDFVDELAESAIPVNRRSAPATQPAFDPKPLIRTFESASPFVVSMYPLALTDTMRVVQMHYRSWGHSQRSWKRRNLGCRTTFVGQKCNTIVP